MRIPVVVQVSCIEVCDFFNGFNPLNLVFFLVVGAVPRPRWMIAATVDALCWLLALYSLAMGFPGAVATGRRGPAFDRTVS